MKHWWCCSWLQLGHILHGCRDGSHGQGQNMSPEERPALWDPQDQLLAAPALHWHRQGHPALAETTRTKWGSWKWGHGATFIPSKSSMGLWQGGLFVALGIASRDAVC